MQKTKSPQSLIAIKSTLFTTLILFIPAGILWIMAALEVTFAVVYPVMTPRVFVTMTFPLAGLLTAIIVSFASVYQFHYRDTRTVTKQATIISAIVIVTGFVVSFFGLI